MKRILRFFSRLSFRLLAFNLLLVFLPAAGVLYLGAYESRLETAEVRAMTDASRMLASGIAQAKRLDVGSNLIERAHASDVRFRIVDTSGNVVADSHRILPPPAAHPSGSPRHNSLYRVAAFILRPVARTLQPPQAPLDVDFYEDAPRLRGDEVADALAGREGFEKKIPSGGQRSVTLYRAVPIVADGRVIGAVVASRSTFSILQDLYAVRLGILRIFVTAVVVAVLVSIFFSTTIIKPLRQLRLDARVVLDRHNRLRGHFKGSKRLDEIGELSRALERIMRRLDSHVTAIETFASDVSHELKNPLASIRTANDMLAEVSEPADRKRFARMINQEVARMEKMLSGMREISRIDAQLVREERAKVAIGELLAKIVDGFQLREGSRVAFDVSVPDEPLLVDASEDRLLQVFENVLDNAAGFSPPGGTVQIRVSAVDGKVVTRIADQGPGIPEPHMHRIFDRFFTYRRAASRHDGAGHTGLGLAIVKAIVEGYGGSIAVTNAEPGAVFEIRLPAA